MEDTNRDPKRRFKRVIILLLVIFICLCAITLGYSWKQVKNRTRIMEKDSSIITFEQAESLASHNTEIFDFKLTEALKVERVNKTLYCYRLLIAPKYDSNIYINDLFADFDDRIRVLLNPLMDHNLQAIPITMRFRYEGVMKAWYVYLVATIDHDTMNANNLPKEEVEQCMKQLNIQIRVNRYFKDSFIMQLNEDFKSVPYEEGIDLAGQGHLSPDGEVYN